MFRHKYLLFIYNRSILPAIHTYDHYFINGLKIHTEELDLYDACTLKIGKIGS